MTFTVSTKSHPAPARRGNTKKATWSRFLASPAGVSPIVQAKLRIGAPNDKYEQEADRVAEQVLTDSLSSDPAPGPTTFLQRKCASCAQGLHPCPECADEQTETILRKEPSSEGKNAAFSISEAPTLSPNGAALSSPLRNYFEPRFNRDFSSVRIHSGSAAAAAANALQAHAYTIGSEIVFAEGRFAPNTRSGTRLLAHELAHVVQQGCAPPRRGSQRKQIPDFEFPPVATMTDPGMRKATIQRLADLPPPGNPTRDINPAERILANPQPWELGLTEDKIVVNSPLQLEYSPSSNGGFDATVKTMPIITNTVTVHTLQPEPWKANTTQAALVELFLDFGETCKDNLPVELVARGIPTADAISAAVDLHERSHVEQITDAFDATVKDWDTNLQQIFNGNVPPYHGPTEVDAEAALFAGVGGTLQNILVRYENERNTRTNNFHGKPMGKPIAVSSIRIGLGSGVRQEGTQAEQCRMLTANISEHPETIAEKKVQDKLERAHEKERRKRERGK